MNIFLRDFLFSVTLLFSQTQKTVALMNNRCEPTTKQKIKDKTNKQKTKKNKQINKRYLRLVWELNNNLN